MSHIYDIPSLNVVTEGAGPRAILLEAFTSKSVVLGDLCTSYRKLTRENIQVFSGLSICAHKSIYRYAKATDGADEGSTTRCDGAEGQWQNANRRGML